MVDSFETAFSDLAYSFLQEKAIKLVDHLVGFEVVKKNDKGSKGLGIFAFKIGDEYLYAPVFFINGEIKPLELLYLKDNDLFVPLDEDWANYLLKKNPLTLGRPSDEKRKTFDSPSLDLFSHPPITGKHVTSALREITVGTHKTLDYLSEASNLVKKAFLNKLITDKPYLQEAISVWGFDDIKSACALHEKQAAETVQEVQVITPDMPEAVRKLNASEKKKVYTNRVVVKDTRSQEKTTKLYNVQYEDKIQNPSVSGVYQLLDCHGNLVEALVLLCPQGPELYGCPKATVVEVSTGQFVCAAPEKIWVKDNFVLDEYEGLYQKLGVINRTKGKIGQTYCFINRNRRGVMSSSPPFQIKQICKDTNGLLSYMVHWTEGLGYYDKQIKAHKGPSYPTLDDARYNEKNTYYDEYSHMSSQRAAQGPYPGCMKAIMSPMQDINDSELYVLSDELMVPGSYSLLPLVHPSDQEGVPFMLGSAGAVKFHLCHNHMNKLRVRSDGSEYFISYNDKQEKPLKKVSAVRLLVNKYQIAGDDALGLLEHAENNFNHPVDVLVKFADIGGISGLEIPDPVIMSDDGFVPKGRQVLNEELITNKGTYPEIPELGKDENLYTSPDAAPPEMDMSAAMQAAEGGQQAVFDHASLASLVGTSDVGEAINKFIPDLEKALDKVGRLLFMFWWNHDEFADLFGITKMNELEDQFRNVFKSFGELILKLKKKERGRLPQ